MAGEWTKTTLGEVLELKRGYDLPRQERLSGVSPIVSSSGISGLHSEAKVRGPGVVTGRYGTIGEVFYVDRDFWPLNTTLYVRDFKGNDPRFVAYFLQLIRFGDYSDKGAVPGVNRNHLHMAPVMWPHIDEQRHIAALLASLDDKIALNGDMSTTLEEIARALFQSWFVDFDPVRRAAAGEDTGLPTHIAALFPTRLTEDGLPDGWETKRADELAHLVRESVDPKQLEPFTPYVGLEHMSKKRLSLDAWGTAATVQSGKSRFIEGDLLFGKLRPYFHKVCITPFDGICSTDIFVFRAKEAVYKEYIYLAFSGDDFVSASTSGVTGTRMPRADWRHLGARHFAIGSPQLLEEFRKLVNPLLGRLNHCRSEVRTLASLRDALLPKLISGELRVRDAAALTENA